MLTVIRGSQHGIERSCILLKWLKLDSNFAPGRQEANRQVNPPHIHTPSISLGPATEAQTQAGQEAYSQATGRETVRARNQKYEALDAGATAADLLQKSTVGRDQLVAAHNPIPPRLWREGRK